MQKQQYTLFLTRDDGDTRSIRFCAATLRLLIFLCVAVPVIAILATYGLLQSWQNTTILAYKNELLSQEMQVYQRELQKYATIQQLVTRYEKEATPILVASKAVPAPVPYDIEEDTAPEDTAPEDTAPENTVSANADATKPDATAKPDANNTDATAVVTMTATDNEDDATIADTPETVVQAQPDTPQPDTPQPDTPQPDTKGPAQTKATDVNTEKTSDKTSGTTLDKPSDNADAERILALQTKPQGANQDRFTTVTDNKAKLTGVTISESKGTVRTSFQLGNTTDTTIAGHIYIAVQGHDKKLHPIRISEKFTAFRIIRYRDYTLEFALPKDFNAADVDKIVITAKTRDGEVFYCNGFALE